MEFVLQRGAKMAFHGYRACAESYSLSKTRRMIFSVTLGFNQLWYGLHCKPMIFLWPDFLICLSTNEILSLNYWRLRFKAIDGSWCFSAYGLYPIFHTINSFYKHRMHEKDERHMLTIFHYLHRIWILPTDPFCNCCSLQMRFLTYGNC